MNCKNCGELLEEEAKLCPVCGASQEEPEPERIVTEEAPEEVNAEETPAEETPEEAAEETVEEAASEETGEGESETPAAPNPKRKKLLRVLAVVCCVSLALALALGIWWGVNGSLLPRENNVQYRDSYTVEEDQLNKALDKVVATCGDARLTNRQLQIYYWNEVFRFLDNYSSYMSYIGLDITQPLSEQFVSDGITYQQYFLDAALGNWHSYQSLVLLAKSEGYTMSEEMCAQLDMMPESLAASANYYGFESVDAMIQADMGPGVNEASYMEYMEQYFLAMDYFDSLYAAMDPDPAVIEAYYAENAETVSSDYGVTKESGPLVDVRHILVLPKGGTTGEDGKTTYSEEEWEACRQEAEGILKEWQEGLADEAFFAELANERSEDPGSNTTGGLYTFVYEGQMVTEFNDWCFDESRQTGDTGLVRTSYGYHVMYFVEGGQGWYRAAEQSYLSDECSKILQEAVENNPMEVKYKAIRLGETSMVGQG